ncbi:MULTISPECIES: FUSC family protein [Tatumella]|uniref:FUSC family protein n=1 Tax=Tatumella punctata TaxID=399969 RepID=A0ABW1VLA8_9GAMM|nr:MULTISPECIES: FUSC family protein [unclassified Tatumella]MBS0856871.1 FUSC family protein [Tatumella sp. JGM16]MBS0877700.1 FUSC family protein [Tatumella sp. JGM82]MBS0891405.1 FUSC family protein [Tatumella sp. JGM94]MBS0892421.1 FUSC family protein [Tatumella sp. JGM130]MBS0902233.1 FUSC family protein [Tatumella sp. JGM100]
MHNSLLFRLRFACKTTFALVMALVLSFVLQLDTPKWSMMTVAIIAASPAFASGGEPMTGVLRFRGFLRLIGTAIGSLGAVIIICGLSRAPVLMLFACCLWAGFFSWLYTIVKQEISYAFGLAGYSVFIILVTAWQTPQAAPQIAIYRSLEISLGLLCIIFSDLIFMPRSIKPQIKRFIDDCPMALFRLMACCFTAANEQEFEERFRHMLEECKKFNAMRQVLKMESTHNNPVLLQRLKGINGLMFHLCTLTYETWQYFHQRPEKRSTSWYLLFSQIPDSTPALTQKLHQFTLLIPQLASHQTPYALSSWIKGLKELRILCTGFHSKVPLHDIEKEIISRYAINAAASVQRKHALVNGFRTFLTGFVGCCLWFTTTSTAVTGFLIISSIVATLAMRAENPRRVAMDFIYGMIYILPVSFFYYLIVLPATQQSFLLLIIAVSILVFFFSLCVQWKILGSAASLMFIFNLIPITNPEVFNFSHYLDSALGQIIGAIVTLLIIWLIPDLSKSSMSNALLRNILTTSLQTLTTNPKRRKISRLSALYDDLLLLITLDSRKLKRYRLGINLIIIYRRITALNIPYLQTLSDFHLQIRETASDLSQQKMAIQRERAYVKLQQLLHEYLVIIRILPDNEKIALVVNDLQTLLSTYKGELISR